MWQELNPLATTSTPCAGDQALKGLRVGATSPLTLTAQRVDILTMVLQALHDNGGILYQVLYMMCMRGLVMVACSEGRF